MRKFALFSLFFIFLGIGVAWGQNTYRWQGNNYPLTLQWNTAANWVLLDDTNGSVLANPATSYPGAAGRTGDSVIIPAGSVTYTIFFGSALSITLKSIEINQPGRIEFNYSSINISNIKINSLFEFQNVTIAVTDTLELNHVLTLNTGSTMSVKNLKVAAQNNAGVSGGTVTMGGGTLTMDPYTPGVSISINPVTDDIGNISTGNRPVTINVAPGADVEIGVIDSGGNVTVNAGPGSSVKIEDIISPNPPSYPGGGNVVVGTDSGDPNDPDDPTGKHWVFSPDNYFSANPGDYYWVDSTITPHPAALAPDPGFNVYIIDVSNAASLNVTTTGNSFIEFRGVYTASGTLTLLPGTGGVRFHDAVITINGGPFNATGNVTLNGTPSTGTSITAADITLGTVTGNNNNLHLTAAGSYSTIRGTAAGSHIGALQITGNGRFGPDGSLTPPIPVIEASSVNVTGISEVRAYISATGTQNHNNIQLWSGTPGSAIRGITGSTITINTVTTSVTGGDVALTLNGDVVLNSASRLRFLTINGDARINGNITTTGNTATADQTSIPNPPLNPAMAYTQLYNGELTLGTNAQLTGPSGGNVIFNGEVKGLAGNESLQITAANAMFYHEVSNIRTLHVTAGTTRINADITTVGYDDIENDANTTQRYVGALTLGANVTLTGPSPRNIRIESTVNGAFDLKIAGANVNFVNQVGSQVAPIRSLEADGSVTIFENSGIWTTNDQIYHGNFIFANATARTLQSSSGSIAFNGAVSRQNPAAPPASITINASKGITMDNSGNTLEGTIILNNNQGTVANDINFRTSAAITITAVNTASGGDININQSGALTIVSLNAPNGSITLGASATAVPSVTNAGTITTGTLTIYSLGPISRNANTNVGTLVINRAGTSIGFINSTALNIGGITNVVSSNIDISTTAGSITVSENITTTGTIVFNSANDIILNAARTVSGSNLALTAVNAVNIIGAVTVSSTGETHNINASVYISAGTLTGSGNINLPSAPSPGWVCANFNTALTFTGNVTGNRIHYHAPLNTNIIYTTSGTATGLTGLTVYANQIAGSDLRLITAGTGNIYIVNIANNAAYTETNTRNINFEASGTGYIEFRQTNLMTGSLSLTYGGASNNIRLNNVALNRGANAFNYNVTLVGSNNDNRITAAGITLGTVMAATANNFNDLSLTATAGNITFNEPIVSGVLRNLTAAASGTININENITTSGNQTYGNPAANTQTILLGASDRVLTGGASAIYFYGTISNITRALTLTNANVEFNGVVSLSALSKTGTGTTTINANITTAAAQNYNTEVILGASVPGTRTLTGTTVTFGGGITGNAHSLTIDADTALGAALTFSGTGAASPSSIITFEKAVNSGSNTARALTITNANVAFNGAVGANSAFPIASVTVNATGTGNAPGYARIGANITTSGAQTYNGPVILNPVTGNNINFTSVAGVMINFANTVTGNTLAGSASPNPRGLTVTTANVTFGGAVGANGSIASIDVNAGSATINANITTTGNQNYGGSAIFGGTTRILTSTGGMITAHGIVSGTAGVTIHAAAGIQMIPDLPASYNSIGGTITLNNDQLPASGNIIFNTTAAITSFNALNSAANGSITINRSGQISINSIETTGTGGSVVLGIGQTNTESVGAVSQIGAIITPNLTIRSSGAITLNNNTVNNEVGSLLIERAVEAVNFTNNISLTIAGISGVAANNINITTTTGSITAGGNIDTTGTVALTSAGSITVNGNIANAAAGTGIITLESANNQNITLNATRAINGARVLLYAGTADNSTGTVTINGDITARNATTDHYANASIHVKAGTLAGNGSITFINTSEVCADLLTLYSYSGAIINGGIHFHSRISRHIVYGHGADDISHGISDYLYINALLGNLGGSLSLTATTARNIYIVGRSSVDFPARAINLTAGGFIEFIGDYRSAGSFTFNPTSGIINLNNAHINLTSNPFTFNATNSRLVLISASSSIEATGITLRTVSSLSVNNSLTLTSAAAGVLINGAIGLTETSPAYTALNNLSITSQNNGTVRLNGEVHSNGTVSVNNSGLFTLASGAHITSAGAFTKSGSGGSRIYANITTTGAGASITFNETLNVAANITLKTNNYAINLVNVSGVQPGSFSLHLDSGTANTTITGAVEIFGSLTVDSSALTAGGAMTVHGAATMRNTGNFTLNANADFKGDYITVFNTGTFISANAVNIKFGAHVILGNISITNSASDIIFYQGSSGAAAAHNLNFLGSTTNSLSNVIIERGKKIILASGIVINQAAGRTLTLETGQGSLPGAVLDVSAGSWFIGSAGNTGQFAGDDGALFLGGTINNNEKNTLSSRLIVNDLNLTSGGFNIDNSGWAFIEVHRNTDIGSSANIFSTLLPYLVLDMEGDGNQKLEAQQTIGSLHVGVKSRTVLNTAYEENVEQPDGSFVYIKTFRFSGEVIIYAIEKEYGLDAAANDLNIIIYAGLSGNRNLINFQHSGSDPIHYSRWEITDAEYKLPPLYSSTPVMDNFVFKQNPNRKVSFRRAFGTTAPVFFEIAGDTLWREFECNEPGAVIQFSRNPDQHTVIEYFSVGHMSSANNPDDTLYVTITRLTEDYGAYPYKYDKFMLRPPSVPGDLGNYALPVYPPPTNLKNSVSAELDKYWNFNIVSAPFPTPLRNFKGVSIYFSHAYINRIPIDSKSMYLHATPYFRNTPYDADLSGFFNYDWIELRKILYSFTEDSDGNGRLDRIRVQANIALNGNFSGFDVQVEGYDLNLEKGTGFRGGGFDLVNDYFDKDSFYIYLIEKPGLDTGTTPRWSVTRNTSLTDDVTKASYVGEPGVDVNIIPFDTIPPRISYTFTLPNHNQTYLRLSEPVNNSDFSQSGLSGFEITDTSNQYQFLWRYFDVDNTEKIFTYTVPQADFGFLLNWNNSFSVSDLIGLRNLKDAYTFSSPPNHGYFIVDNIIDQARQAMDWSDPVLDPAFFMYYQPPKYPLDWGYSAYAYISGNSHMAGVGNDPGFLNNPHEINAPSNPLDITDVLLPPFKLLTVDMINDLISGNGNLVTPSRFDGYTGALTPSKPAEQGVTRRVTDALISMPPANSSSNSFFVWPVWARYVNPLNPDGYRSTSEFYDRLITDTGVIWNFGGSEGVDIYLGYLENKGEIDLQARLGSDPSLSGLKFDLLWAVNMPTRFRDPMLDPVRGRNTGGLWLPNTGYYYATPAFDANFILPASPSLISSSPLLSTFRFGSNASYSSGDKIEFIFRFNNNASNQDMYIARLDIQPNEAAPANWYQLVRPFGFDIQNIRHQRGGVTILNNVINSNNREVTYLRYHLLRPGRVTIQVYTLDGTLVRSIRRNEYREPGEWTDGWNGTNNSGMPVARGMYYIRIVGPDIDEIRQVMVVR
ncbi:MAG: hypothetical protein FWC21_04240 [Treponema sp.]|nr:hypothetical protein [Treponema sp.]